MDAMKELQKIRGYRAPIDPMAMELQRVINAESSKHNDQIANWEHENLAKVKIKVFRGHTDEINKCQFFCNDSRILSTSVDCSIKVWDPVKGTVLKSLDNVHAGNASDAHCLEDGSQCISCGWDKVLQLWDLEESKNIWTAYHMDMLTCCKFSSDGRLACVGSAFFRELSVYDIISGNVVAQLGDWHKHALTACGFSPDNSRVITTSADRSVKFYDLRSETCTIRLGGHGNVISSFSITEDERKFATASWDKTVNIWDIATGMYRSKGPDVLKDGHEGSITSCNFADDGLQLVTGSADKSIVVWDMENNVKKLRLQGHSGWVTDVHFSKDQNLLLSSSKDGTLRIWNIEESDQIPIVMENKKALGMKVIKCHNCGKVFSLFELENFKDVTSCVFCRLKKPEETWLTFQDD